jgi:cytochrome c peroxidase
LFDISNIMKTLGLLLLVLNTSALAQSAIDQKLQSYIAEFNLTSVTTPAPLNRKLFILGRELFFETALSGNNNISCADCHHPRVMTHDALPLALGEGARGLQMGEMRRMQQHGRVQARNTPALFNLHNVNVMFWDGRVEFDPQSGTFTTPVELPPKVKATLKSALATQAIFPIVNREEMQGQPGSNPIADAASEAEAWELIVARLMSMPKYQQQFAELFPGEDINIGHVGEAIAEFEGQAFYSSDTPYDRYLQGKLEALTPRQKLGMDMFFGKGRCGECHQGEHLSAFDFDSVGVPQIGPGLIAGDDLGRFQWDQEEESRYAFRVPPLRNVALTAPYMHNGALSTLARVIHHYDDIEASLASYRFLQGLTNYLLPIRQHDPANDSLRLSQLPEDLPLRIGFSETEKAALLDFLTHGLTDLRFH